MFGSSESIIYTRITSSESFNVTIKTVVLVYAFVSTAFYPDAGAPAPLATAFYVTPLNYIVDVIRAGFFGTFNDFILIEMIVLVLLALGSFSIATKLLTRLDF